PLNIRPWKFFEQTKKRHAIAIKYVSSTELLVERFGIALQIGFDGLSLLHRIPNQLFPLRCCLIQRVQPFFCTTRSPRDRLSLEFGKIKSLNSRIFWTARQSVQLNSDWVSP